MITPDPGSTRRIFLGGKRRTKMKALYFDADPKKIALIKVVSLLWKKASLSRLSPLRYAEVEEPEIPGPNWVKLKNRMCGLCGSDVHFMLVDIDPKVAPAAVPPVPRKFLGHEVVSEVLEAGPGASEFSPGDRVVLRIDWPSCFQRESRPMCSQCGRGNYLLCENPGWEGLPKNPGGGFSPCMVAHKAQIIKIENQMPDEQAILIEPSACAARAVLKRPPGNSDKVLVIGGGTIGLCVINVLKAIHPDVEVYALCRYPHQREFALRLGASGIIRDVDTYQSVAEITGGRYLSGPFGNKMIIGGFDRIYDSVGNDRSIRDALRWTRSEGSVVILGLNLAPRKLDYSPVWFQEVELLGINSHGRETFRGRETNSFDVALTLYREGRLHLSDFVTHVFPAGEYPKALETFLGKGTSKAIKVALTHS